MADYTNNYKYVAEAWIENGEEEGFKTSFLNSLFLQWQGHSDDEQNPKFNADMVDGHHYSEIEGLINEAVSNTIQKFYLGYTHIGGHGEDEHYIIGSEAVRLYPNTSTMTEVPSGFNTYQEYIDSFIFPWNPNSTEEYEVGSLQEITNPNLYQVIKEMYYQLQDDLSEKADLNEFESFKQEQEDFNSQFDNFHFTEDGIDASSVNGLRFFIVTQEQYENVSEESKRNIHNIYIIKEEEDITSYYESIGESNKTQYDGNPDIAPWDRAYEFKVGYTTYNNQENVLCLMYKLTSEDDTQWKVIAPTRDFIDEENLDTLISENLNEANRPLDKNNFIASVNYFNPTSDKKSILKFPITRVYDDRYISGARYPNYTQDESGLSTIDVPIITRTENITDASGTTVATLKILDLKNPLSNLKTVLDNKINSVKNIIGNSNDSSSKNTLYGKIRQNTESIGSITNSFNNFIGNSTKTLPQLESDIAGLGDEIAREVKYNLTTNINTWDKYYLGGYIFPKVNATVWRDKAQGQIKTSKTAAKNPSVNFNQDYYVSKVEVNRILGLARIYLSFYHYYRTSQKGKWVRPTAKYYDKKTKKYEYVSWYTYWTSVVIKPSSGQNQSPDNVTTTLGFKEDNKYIAKPYSNIVYPSKSYPQNCFININPNCTTCSKATDKEKPAIYVNCNLSKEQWVHFYGSVVYPIETRDNATFDISEDDMEEYDTGDD